MAQVREELGLDLRHVGEAREVAVEADGHGLRRPVAVLRDDEVVGTTERLAVVAVGEDLDAIRRIDHTDPR